MAGFIDGYAATYNTETTIAGAFREKIAPGAFAEALTTDDVVALFNHNPSELLGRKSAGSLQLTSDRKGLHYAIPVDPEDALSVRVHRLVKTRKLKGSSFGFSVVSETWERPTRQGELPRRTLDKVTLHDVSPVTYPAYPATEAEARGVGGTVRAGYLTSSSRGGASDTRAIATAMMLCENKETVPCRRCGKDAPPQRLEIRSGKITAATCATCASVSTRTTAPAATRATPSPRRRLDSPAALKAEAARLARMSAADTPKRRPSQGDELGEAQLKRQFKHLAASRR